MKSVFSHNNSSPNIFEYHFLFILFFDYVIVIHIIFIAFKFIYPYLDYYLFNNYSYIRDFFQKSYLGDAGYYDGILSGSFGNTLCFNLMYINEVLKDISIDSLHKNLGSISDKAVNDIFEKYKNKENRIVLFDGYHKHDIYFLPAFCREDIEYSKFVNIFNLIASASSSSNIGVYDAFIYDMFNTIAMTSDNRSISQKMKFKYMLQLMNLHIINFYYMCVYNSKLISSFLGKANYTNIMYHFELFLRRGIIM